MKSVLKNDTIEFLCDVDLYEIMPRPVPATKNIPDWFKLLPGKLDGGFNSSTVKRCNPFLDALSVGYIIPLACDIHITTDESASNITWDSRLGSESFPRPMIEPHNPEQIKGCPVLPKPPCKFMNYWMIKTPPEYSLLFLPPLNRTETRFTCFSGVVDSPYPQWEYVNFPFVFNEANFNGIIPAGTPLVQVIPIRKDSLLKQPRWRVFKEEEREKTKWLRKMRTMIHESFYRDKLHRKL